MGGFVHMGISTSEGPSMHLTAAIAMYDWSYSKLLADIAFDAASQDEAPRQYRKLCTQAASHDKPAADFPVNATESDKDVIDMINATSTVVAGLPLETCGT